MIGFMLGIYCHSKCKSPNISDSLLYMHKVVLHFLAFFVFGPDQVIRIHRSGMQAILGFNGLHETPFFPMAQ